MREITRAQTEAQGSIKDLLPGMVRTSPGLQETWIRAAITAQGGVFLGRKEFLDLGVIEIGDELPPIPNEYSTEFFSAGHPMREGPVGKHVIFAFDRFSSQWHCFETTVLPNSENLSGDDQDRLLLKPDGSRHNIGGLVAVPVRESMALIAALDAEIAALRRFYQSAWDPPFGKVQGRTADTAGARPGCRNIIAFNWEDDPMLRIMSFVPTHEVREDVGLAVEWVRETEIKTGKKPPK